METVTKVGYCRFCNTGKMLEVVNDEDLAQDILNELATEECDCYLAQDAKKKKLSERSVPGQHRADASGGQAGDC